MSQTTLELGFHPANLSISGDIHLEEEFMGAVPVGQLPFNIIQDDQDLNVKFNFHCAGILVNSLWGHWHLGVHFEKIGPGEGPASIFWSGPNGLLTPTLNQTITIPNTHFAPVLLEGQNVFKLVATMVYHKAVAPFGMPIAGFKDLGMIQVYNDGQ